MSELVRELLEDYCDEASAWVHSFSSATPSEIYAKCQDGVWLMWIVENVGVPERVVVPAACEIARLVLAHCTDPRPRIAVERAEAWARGCATLDGVLLAAEAAAEVANAEGQSSSAGEVARAAYHAASAADANSDRSKYHATDAASFTTLAASTAAAEPLSEITPVDFIAHCKTIADASDNAFREAARQCADIVRKHIPFPAIAAAKLNGRSRSAAARDRRREMSISEWCDVPSSALAAPLGRKDR